MCSDAMIIVNMDQSSNSVVWRELCRFHHLYSQWISSRVSHEWLTTTVWSDLTWIALLIFMNFKWNRYTRISFTFIPEIRYRLYIYEHFTLLVPVSIPEGRLYEYIFSFMNNFCCSESHQFNFTLSFQK